MLAIEIRPREEDSDPETRQFLLVNGKYIEHSWGRTYGKRRHGGINGAAAVNEVLSYPLSQIFHNLDELTVPFAVDWCEDLVALKYSSGGRECQSPHVQFEFRFESEEWARPWSIQQFALAVKKAVIDRALPTLTIFRSDLDYVENGFGFICTIERLDVSGKEEIEKWTPVLKDIIVETHRWLSSTSSGHSIAQTFRFPEQVAVACEQYLIYFGQFLADLGIDATVDLSHSVDHVLFRVTPQNSKEALETIRSALNAYLNMPGEPLFEAMPHYSNDIAVLQLRANITHLQSQLTLAQAVLQAKDATIDALQLSNYRLQQLSSTASANVLLATGADHARTDSERLINGVLSVRPTEMKGLVIHWPDILRKLKRRLRRTDADG